MPDNRDEGVWLRLCELCAGCRPTGAPRELNLQSMEEGRLASIEEEPYEQGPDPDADSPFLVLKCRTWPTQVDARQGWDVRSIPLEQVMPFGCQNPHLATFLAQTAHTPGAACDKMRLREIEEGGTGGGQSVKGETERVELRNGRTV